MHDDVTMLGNKTDEQRQIFQSITASWFFLCTVCANIVLEIRKKGKM
jgi:hypothetical protein